MKCSFDLVAIIWRWCLDKSNSGCVKFTIPLISEISNQNSENNGVNRAGPVGNVLGPADVPWFDSGDCQNKVV